MNAIQEEIINVLKIHINSLEVKIQEAEKLISNNNFSTLFVLFICVTTYGKIFNSLYGYSIRKGTKQNSYQLILQRSCCSLVWIGLDLC